MSTRKTATLAAALYPAAVLALTAVHVLWPQRSGLLALSQIVAPYLFLGTVVFVPFALLAGARVLRVLLVVVLLVGVLRFGEEVVSLGGPIYGAADAISALSWNLEAGDVRGEQLSAVLRSTNASIVALQELTPARASLLESDPQLRVRFPHRMLAARSGVLGIGLLSARTPSARRSCARHRASWSRWSFMERRSGSSMRIRCRARSGPQRRFACRMTSIRRGATRTSPRCARGLSLRSAEETRSWCWGTTT
jgi:hypothetical protein